jgi:hypothetical protein
MLQPQPSKELQAVMVGFALGTGDFISTEGPLEEQAIRDTWNVLWAEWYIRRKVWS